MHFKSIKNSNHPQIAYWFLTPEILFNEKYLQDLDSIVNNSLFDFIFLDAREGCSFNDIEKMHPALEKIVNQAHRRNIKVGFRTGLASLNPVPEEITERFIMEGEVTLDNSGQGSCSMNSEFIRARSSYKKSIFKVFVFKKTDEGFYDPATLMEISDYDFSVRDETVKVSISAGKEFSGYSAYVMTEFHYRSLSNHSQEAVNQAIKLIDSYSDIPFDGIMLDECGNPGIIPPWKMKFRFGNYRNRSYSLPLARELEVRTGEPACLTLFNMRYAPEGKPETRIKAINTYMDLMREGPMHIENVVYKRAKEVYGPDCFIGAHNTFHNSLINDEIWATGLKWWSIPREYGFTDEETPLPTQIGISMSYPKNVMYNMYYNYNIKKFVTKTLTGLRYGIRTFYHAFNDKNWGISLEKPEALNEINPVENCARLLNRFNPSLPEIKLLVIFGNEALQNWYPEKSVRGSYDINSKLGIEEKAVKIWNAGYMNALVPTDLINEGKLKLDGENKPVMYGHKFDAIIFLYPQYSKEPVLKFLEDYVNTGGKLMIEGSATHDFEGKDISSRMKNILTKSTTIRFSISGISKLGIVKNAIANGCKNEDGSFVFTDIQSLRNKKATSFSINVNNDNYSAEYEGLAAIAIDPQKGLQKFACAGFKELRKNGQVILSIERQADIFIEKQGDAFQITIPDQTKPNITEVNKLF